MEEEKSRGYPTRTRKQVTSIIPTLVVKTYNIRNTYLNTDTKMINIIEEERDSHMIHITM